MAIGAPAFTTENIDWLIAEADRTNGPELKSIEELLGIRLHEVNRSRSFVTSRGRTKQGYMIEMRTDIPGSHATAGALLLVDGLDGCIRVNDIRAKYGKLRLKQSPSGHSLDQFVGWTIDRPWGEVTFGFNERISDCLSRLAFSAANPKS
ncbi:hypothetical protein [Sphingomonas sp. PP-CE-3G-477]|uniref:hypothetical protein n=1 Tax=Sphingomonas sp. PP-CE-3G-477 TaxID=2135660 RepID=UPI0011B1D2CA|nr:hypothetical protein [Sphingomonas sp. PP-CE-3G-477]